MNNNLLRIKIQQRLNKLASSDYDNIECWQIAEAFNKAQEEWFRRQVHGINLKKEGSEESTVSIDDLQKFVTTKDLSGSSIENHFKTEKFPTDYAHFIRIAAFADNDGCTDREMTVYLGEEANVDLLLSDAFKNPSFEWGETFGTMMGDTFKIYHDKKFTITKAKLSYYRKPKRVAFSGCIDVETGEAALEQECEMRSDVTELIVDETAAILAGDIESWNQMQRESQNAQRSN
jgi:hypothetical protein